MDYNHNPPSPPIEKRDYDYQDRMASSKIKLGGRLFFDIWNPCFTKEMFGRVLFIMTKPDSHIILRRLRELKGNSAGLDLISTHEVPPEIGRMCENIFICKDGILPDRRTVKFEDLPLLGKPYHAIFLDYHIWQDAPREAINHYLIFLRFPASNIYSINSFHEIIDYHDFERLYIETDLKEVQISGCGIIGPECCQELYDSAKTYGKKGIILNIGAYLGRSTIALALGSKKVGGGKVVSIDPILPAEFYENIRENNVSDYIIPIQMTSEEAYKSWPKIIEGRFETKIGLLFVDGDHVYQDVSFDISHWKNHLACGGLLLVDDYERNQPGVMRAVYEEIACSGEFSSISMPIHRLIRAERK